MNTEPQYVAIEQAVPLEDTKPPLSLFRMIWYSLANLGYGTFFSFNNAILPLFLKAYTNNAIVLGLLSSSHSVEGAIIQPIVGTLSDRMRSRFGRRRPFLLLFIPLCALFMVITPPLAHLPAGIRLAALVFCIFLFTVFFNIAFDPYQAMMPDITPPRQRGRVTAVWTVFGVFGQAGILFLPVASLDIKFYVVAGLMLVTTLLTCQLVNEPDSRAMEVSSKNHLAEMVEAAKGLRTLKQARRGLIVFFLSGAGVGAVLPYLTTFVQKITHCSDQAAQNMFLVLMLSTAFTVIPMGWLTDRLGTKTILVASLVLIGIASLNGLWVSTLGQITAVLFVAGLGNAAQSAASYPLMTQLVPSEEVGFYTGLQTMALSIAQPLTVLVTGELINQGSYRVIFAVCAGCMLAALAVLTMVDRNAAVAEIEKRRLELSGGRAVA
jgi:maltose/moltooligosaccharide transporter